MARSTRDETQIRDLCLDDLEAAKWAGSEVHLSNIKKVLNQAARGESVVLGAWKQDRLVGLGGVLFNVTPGAGRLWALNVHPEFQSQGIGSALIKRLEVRTENKKVLTVELLVAISNVKGKALYDRLGYEVVEEDVDPQERIDPDGTLKIVNVPCFRMIKVLGTLCE